MKIIINFPHYKINQSGQVWSEYSKKYIAQRLYKNYLWVCLHKDKKSYTKSVHRLVLETFIGLCPKGMQACHNNGIKTDNRLENLRWDTPHNNQLDTVKHRTQRSIKLFPYEVQNIRKESKQGKSQRVLAKKFNISRWTIWGIIKRKTWKHL